MDSIDNPPVEDVIIGHLVPIMFSLLVQRYVFRALDSVYFPPYKAGNVVRGALLCSLDSALRAGPQMPSGLSQPPRPFVLRTGHLDGKRFAAGETFSFDLHLFDCSSGLGEQIDRVLANLSRTGLGARRGRLELAASVVKTPVTLDLSSSAETANHVAVRFVTPTDLKGCAAHAEPMFGTLFRRSRDRISTLRSLYGEGEAPIDFKSMGHRADLVRTVMSDLIHRGISRRSSRTGDVHDIGGLTGAIEYEGELGEFLPWLRAAWWTGVGRHTVWGNGVIEVVIRG